ncbi:hypothetical protein FIU97_07950 [Roseivivax sp. THAF40]|uniref:hypothetical protein n=1 Tax=unclassified Roseivivax TaxID=2639302 RepID=UPI001269244D|nr:MULTISPECIES: hypothetical protein [unclassified Roseivivax]QFS82730.1 hypothetical protein FIV09_07845 [Roseivivax sp. THAF197b]QFT46499.1 hypothetical protein FIU97_07950 [Roseivivax sp. THAF40]
MTLPVRPHAALAVPSLTGLQEERFLRIVRDVMTRFDAKSGQTPKASIKHSAVASDTMMVKINIERSPKTGARLVFRVAPRPNAATPCIDKSVEILSDIVMRSLQFVEADRVEWLDERTLLSPEEFQASCSYVSPKRQRREMIEAPVTERSICEIEESLARMFEDSPPVTEPGHGRERAAKIAAARRAASETLKKRAVASPAWETMPEDDDGIEGDEDYATDAASDCGADAPDKAERGSLMQRIAEALHLRTVAHVSALSGMGLVFWKTGMFEPILAIVGV